MKNLKLFTVLTLMFFPFKVIYAETTITGNIYSSTSWTTSGSPYIIANDIVVFSSAVLTIEPGVIVKFNDGITIDFRGQLVAVGTPDAFIMFTSADSVPAMGAYVGFKVTGTCGSGAYFTNQLTLTYCNVYYASDFMDLGTSCAGPFNITNCNFRYNRYVDANSADFADLIFDHCTFDGNYQGVNWNDGGDDVYVSNCTFTNNTIGAVAVYVTNSTFSGNTNMGVYAYTTMEHCEIFGNNLGAEWDAHASTTMTNNYIHDNSIGVQLDRFWNDAGIVFEYNKICHNSVWNIQYNFYLNGYLSNNCFCSSDSSYIRSTLRDGYVDASYGLLSYNIDSSCMAGVTSVKLIVSSEENSVKVFPNPFSYSTTFQFNYAPGQNYQLVLMDQLGRTVKSMDQINSGSVVVSGDNMSPGLYYYQLKNEQQVLNTGKVVVE